MTTVEPTTRRRKRRTSAPTASTPARSRGVRITRTILTGLWLVGVPAFAGAYVDQHIGDKLANIPLNDEAHLAAPLVAVLVAFAAAMFLHRRRLITLFAVVPVVVAWIGYVGFGGGTGGWLGLLAGLGVGVLGHAWRQRKRR